MITIKCRNCGKEKELYPSRIKKGKPNFCNSACSNSYNNLGKKNHFSRDKYFGKGKESANWKGGRKEERGYTLIYDPNHPDATNGYVREHRLIMEKKLGRRLGKKEVVHHMNHNKQDNRPENLMLLNGSEHAKAHNFGKYDRKNI